jgi:hypothetical protein
MVWQQHLVELVTGDNFLDHNEISLHIIRLSDEHSEYLEEPSILVKIQDDATLGG